VASLASLLNLGEKLWNSMSIHIVEAFYLKTNAGLILHALKYGLISVDPEANAGARTAHDKK
jgi:hypothetical protein